MKRKLLIAFLITIGIICLVFLADDYIRSEYEDPNRVGKAFCLSYVTQNSKSMKEWADEKIYEKIDDLKFSSRLSLPIPEAIVYKSFELVCFRKVGYTIVSTYVWDFFKEAPFCYSCVLKPVGDFSLWEHFKKFTSDDVPFGNHIVWLPIPKKRWLVVDFFVSDAYEKHIEKIQKMKSESEFLEAAYFPSLDVMFDQENYEERWSQAEMTQQNKEIEKLYKIYRNPLHNSPERNLLKND